MIAYAVIVFFLLFLLLLIWIVFTPIVVEINSDSARYEVRQRGILFMRFNPHKVKWELRLLGINIPLRKTEEKKPKTQKLERSEKKKKGFHRSANTWRFLIQRGLMSLRLRKLWIDIDTDDVVLNAQLVPLVYFLSRGPVKLSTNYNGRVSLQLLLEGQLNKLIWVFMRFLTKK